MHLIIDEKLFSDTQDFYRKEIVKMSNIENFYVSFSDSSSNPTIRHEIIPILSLSVATFSLIISILKYIEVEEKTFTRQEVIDEIEAYLKLKNIENYKFTFEEGFENIILKNGKPCTIGVTVGEEGNTMIYFGVTTEQVWVSSIKTDWRAFT